MVLKFDPFLDHCCRGRHKQITAPDGTLAIVYAGSPEAPTIQDALGKLVVAGGGTVFLPPGYTETITATITTPNDNVAIICPTRDAVITDGSAGGINMIDANGKDYCTIRGVKFVGLGAGKATKGITNLTGTAEFWHISWCWFHDCNFGLYTYLYDFNNMLFERNYFTGHASWAIYIRQGGSYNVIRECKALNGTFTSGFLYIDWSSSYNLIQSCWVENCGSACFAFAVPGQGRGGTRNIIDRCVASRNQYGFYVYRYIIAERFLELRSCLAYGNYKHGFLLSSDASPRGTPLLLTGCWAIDNSYTNNNVYSGFYIDGFEDRIMLQNCSAYQIGYQQKYGFEIAAGATKCEVRGGVWSPNQTGSWLDNGTDTVIDARDD